MKNNFLFVLSCIFFFSCGNEKVYTPKPRGFFLIELPEPEYKLFDTACAYSMEIPKNTLVIPFKEKEKQCWFNIVYPRFDATIYMSYNRINNNLPTFLEDVHKLVYGHTVKANGIAESAIQDSVSNIYGMKYLLEGDVASPYQFYLTDNKNHFFRAALYFNFKPNYDSLAPVLNHIKIDMDKMVDSFKWK